MRRGEEGQAFEERLTFALVDARVDEELRVVQAEGRVADLAELRARYTLHGPQLARVGRSGDGGQITLVYRRNRVGDAARLTAARIQQPEQRRHREWKGPDTVTLGHALEVTHDRQHPTLVFTSPELCR